MSNMSYCRFENTLSDLRDCQFALEDRIKGTLDPLSESELYAARHLAWACMEIVMMVHKAQGAVLTSMDEQALQEAVKAINDTLKD